MSLEHGASSVDEARRLALRAVRHDPGDEIARTRAEALDRRARGEPLRLDLSHAWDAALADETRRKGDLVGAAILRDRAREVERREREVAAAPRALGWIDVEEARDRVEGTARRRYAPLAEVKRTVGLAREKGHAAWIADHNVRRSYSYPVRFTRVEAERLDTGDVLVTFVRTQTWGREPDRRSLVVISADMVPPVSA